MVGGFENAFKKSNFESNSIQAPQKSTHFILHVSNDYSFSETLKFHKWKGVSGRSVFGVYRKPNA